MSLSCIAGSVHTAKADAVVVFVPEDEKKFAALTKDLLRQIPHLQPVLDTKDVSGKVGMTAVAYTGSATAAPRLIFCGMGGSTKVTAEHLRKAGAAATKRAAALGCTNVAYVVPHLAGHTAADVTYALTEGSMLSQYRFDKYITKKSDDAKLVSKFTFVVSDKAHVKAAAKAMNQAAHVVEGVIAARDLANAPNCEIYPATLGKRAQELGKKAGFSVTVLDKGKIESLKMGGLLGVNQGSVRPPVFIVMEYKGGKKAQKPIVLVGKGVTFDTGGISLKPAGGMSDMKSDMHGAATVIGCMVAIANLKLPVNVVALVPATENMPSGTAMVPGDILTFMNGKTAEIDNTDAEGRLILADALCYAARYEPLTVIDFATLTGACVVALGSVTSGMMGTDDKTKSALKASADRVNEYVCELPLYSEYEDQIKSDYADIKNSGGREAGAITAALFLKHFVSYPWVHMDIAGTGIQSKPSAYTPKGASGVGVRLIVDFLQHWKA
jgi:leucyl aminopeptidase